MSKDIFNRIAAVYDILIPAHIMEHYLEKRVNFIKSFSRGGFVLDAGCGTGTLVKELEESGFKVVGLDYAQEMLKQMKNKRNGSLVAGDLTSIPLRENTFDLVVSITVLHHLKDKQTILESICEMIRVCKPKGKIIIWEHNRLNPYWKIFLKKLPIDTDVKRLIPLSEIISDLKAAGVLNISVYKTGFTPDFIPRLLLRPWQILEKIVQRTPLLNIFCAHNVVIGEKEINVER